MSTAKYGIQIKCIRLLLPEYITVPGFTDELGFLVCNTIVYNIISKSCTSSMSIILCFLVIGLVYSLMTSTGA